MNYKLFIWSQYRHFLKELKKRIKGRNWIVLQNAVSDKIGMLDFNVMSGHGGASSLLEPSKTLAETTNCGDIVEVIKVKTTTVDDIIKHHLKDSKNIYIKVDVQGHEVAAMDGMQKYKDLVTGIRLEMSISGDDDEN